MNWTDEMNNAGDRWRTAGQYRIVRVPLHGGGADYEAWHTGGSRNIAAWRYIGRYGALLEAESAVDLDAGR